MTEKGGKPSCLWLTRRGGEYPSHSCPACAELRRGKPGQIPPERGYGDINWGARKLEIGRFALSDGGSVAHSALSVAHSYE